MAVGYPLTVAGAAVDLVLKKHRTTFPFTPYYGAPSPWLMCSLISAFAQQAIGWPPQ